jgi:hypothetical protein
VVGVVEVAMTASSVGPDRENSEGALMSTSDIPRIAAATAKAFMLHLGEED